MLRTGAGPISRSTPHAEETLPSLFKVVMHSDLTGTEDVCVYDHSQRGFYCPLEIEK